MRSPLPLLIALALSTAVARAQDDRDWNARKKVVSEIFEKAYEDDLPAEAAEIPVFDPTGTGDGAPPDPSLVVAAIQGGITGLFDSYEREDMSGFLSQVHPGFTSRDDLSNDYRFSDLVRALQDDFDVLDRIQFTVQVGQPIVQADGRRAQVEVRWSRRAWVQIGGQEWIVQNQRTVFLFEYSPNPGWKIVRIFGEGVFAVSTRLGQIVVTEGTIDGVVVTDPILLDKIKGVIEQEKPSTPAPPTFVPPISGSMTFERPHIDFDTQTFEDFCEVSAGGWDVIIFCGRFEQDIRAPAPAGVRELSGSLGLIAELPPGPYGDGSGIFLDGGPGDVGRVFAYQTDQGKFGAFEIVSVQFGQQEEGLLYTIRFLHQTDGSRRLKP